MYDESSTSETNANICQKRNVLIFRPEKEMVFLAEKFLNEPDL